MQNTYFVGKSYEEWKTKQMHIQMSFDELSWSLIVGFPGITNQEIKELQTGDFNVAYVTVDDTLFFLFKIGGVGWCDCPYEPRLYKTPLDYPEIEDVGSGAALCVYIVDTNTGVLKGLRNIGLGHIFSNNLHATCRQMDKIRLMTKEQHAENVNQIYKKYPDSKDLLRLANPANMFSIKKKT